MSLFRLTLGAARPNLLNMNAATATTATRTAHKPYADQPTYTSWRLMGKRNGYDHEVVFQVQKEGDRVGMIHTYFGANKCASGGRYNAMATAFGTREEARAEFKRLLGEGYKRT